LKLSRLFQPKNLQFWLLVALNLLSAAISWLLQNREFPLAIMLALATFALANLWLGLRIALRLMKEPPGLAEQRLFANCGLRARAPRLPLCPTERRTRARPAESSWSRFAGRTSSGRPGRQHYLMTCRSNAG